jgi:hypothetical protein
MDDTDACGSTALLRGVVACLSGMPMESKERLHTLITTMGGRYELSPQVRGDDASIDCLLSHSRLSLILLFHVYSTVHGLHHVQCCTCDA